MFNFAQLTVFGQTEEVIIAEFLPLSLFVLFGHFLK